MKKYLLTFAVALMAAFAFTACSSSDDDDPTPGPTPVPTGQPFTVTALDGISDVSFNIVATFPGFTKSDVKLVYSFDGKEWEDYELGSKIHLSSTKPKVFLKAGTKANPNVQNKSFRTSDPDNNYLTTNLTFESSMRVKVSGNLLSLLYGDKAQRTVQGDIPYAFVRLFYNCDKLVDASELQMPTNVSNNMFETAFQGCKALIAAPELPAKTLAKQCYYYMFFGCTALKIAPELPATTLAEMCYGNMFQECEALTKGPSKLPAAKLEKNSCQSMFLDCKSLTDAPQIEAKEVAEGSCQDMFLRCTSLVKAPELPATTVAPNCYSSMFVLCESLKTAPSKLPATKLASGCYASMFGGCKVMETAPVLPASEANVDHAYMGMFSGCVKLNLVEMLATKVSIECVDDFLNGAGTSATNATLYVAKGMKSNPIIAAMENSTWTVKEK